MKDDQFRPLSKSEEQILEKLLELDFVGRDELMRQIPGLLAKQVDDNGSLMLKVQSSDTAPGRGGPVVEASYPDGYIDQASYLPVQIHIILHVRDGKMHMLEIYKDDGSAILNQPNLSNIAVFARSPKMLKET